MILPGKQTDAGLEGRHSSRVRQVGVSAIIACSLQPGNRALPTPLFTFNFDSSHNIYRKHAHSVSCSLRARGNANIPGPSAGFLTESFHDNDASGFGRASEI